LALVLLTAAGTLLLAWSLLTAALPTLLAALAFLAVRTRRRLRIRTLSGRR
jgi:hypothetical protein